MIIYKTTNTINGKIYVGQDAINDPAYFGSGMVLEKAIRKYGVQNFRKDILEHCSSKQQLNEREIFWISFLNATNRRIGYNIAKGGTGGNVFGQLSKLRQQQCVQKRQQSRPQWDTSEYRKKLSEHSKLLWTNPHHRSHMRRVMTGRQIKWKDKIGAANKQFWQEHGDVRSEESKKRAAKKCREKMMGKEFKSIPEKLKQRIVSLYQTMGPKSITKQISEEGYSVSPYLIIRVLKKKGIYQPWQKGIGDKKNKIASISRRGAGNPMYGHRKVSAFSS